VAGLRWGAYSAPPDSVAGFNKAYFYGRGEDKGRREKGQGRGGQRPGSFLKRL